MMNLNTYGKKLTILNRDGKSVISKQLYIDGEVDLKTNSNFTPIWKGSSNSLLNLVSSSFSFNGSVLPSGQFPMQGVQIWESTEPLNFNISANLYMIDSGKNDVVAPSMFLMSLPLPTKSKSMISDLVSEKFNINIQTLIPPGPNIKDILLNAMDNKNDIYDESFGSLFSTSSRGVFTLKIADNITIPNVIVKGVDCNFSSLLDTDGYPTSSQLDFEFTTMEIATTDMLHNIYKGIN